MKPIVFDPAATREALEARIYLERQSVRLGDQFDQDLMDAATEVQALPRSYPIERGRIRRFTLKKFSYSLLYVELDDFIWIAAVAHHSRRPNYWRERRPPP